MAYKTVKESTIQRRLLRRGGLAGPFSVTQLLAMTGRFKPAADPEPKDLNSWAHDQWQIRKNAQEQRDRASGKLKPNFAANYSLQGLAGQDPVYSGSNPLPYAIQQSVSDATALASRAETKTAQAAAGLAFMLSGKTGADDPSIWDKDALYFGGGNFDALISQDGIKILTNMDAMVSELDAGIATFTATTSGDPAFAATMTRLAHAEQAARALLQRWRWYEMQNAAGTTNVFDEATGAVKREVLNALGIDPKKKTSQVIDDAIPSWLKWAVGIFTGIQILNALKK